MKRRNQASVRGCTQSYYYPYQLQRLAPTPASVFPRNCTPDLSYSKRQSNHSATSAVSFTVEDNSKEKQDKEISIIKQVNTEQKLKMNKWK
jgi:hypothetical protein